MTAAKTVAIAAPAVTEEVRRIFLDDLQVAPWNARKTIDPAQLSELAASIKEHGVQVPLLVRQVAVDYCEIVAGHRRFTAAQQLGLATVPCIVRELNDDQAREIGLVDNLQRADVPALEEADAYAELQQRLGTPAAIAARVGKDVAYVARRLQLVGLGEMPRKALAERLITVDHALLLARLGVDEQNENLKWALNVNAGKQTPVEDVIAERIKDHHRVSGHWGYWEPQSVLDLKYHIEQNVGRKLSSAPWKLDDAELFPAVGACSDCPHNTTANDALFGDLNIEDATCENGSCFEAKRATFVNIQAAKIEGGANGQDVLRISWKTSTAKPRTSKEGGFNLKQTFRFGQWIDAKPKSCEFVRSAVSVDWDEGGYGNLKKRKPGEILNVCIEEKCKVHKKGYAEQKREPGMRNENSAEARADRGKREAEAKAENAVRVGIIRKALDGVKKLPAEILRRLLVETCEAAWNIEGTFPGIAKVLKTKPVDSADFARAAVSLVFGNDKGDFFVSEYNPRDLTKGRKELIALLKTLGYDASKAWDKPAELKPAKAAKKPPAKKAAKKGGRK